ncbi:hypothetical protein E2C01_080326 [Portunus trituberculatus]|uniref:Uncharacterized protein n=1 Tax=Portunus trituberculatus TaxID=210409 RepID=A0A5B7ISX5_PORTR|nr:hypothetical protein [Portunus trituberculatus]
MSMTSLVVQTSRGRLGGVRWRRRWGIHAPWGGVPAPQCSQIPFPSQRHLLSPPTQSRSPVTLDNNPCLPSTRCLPPVQRRPSSSHLLLSHHSQIESIFPTANFTTLHIIANLIFSASSFLFSFSFPFIRFLILFLRNLFFIFFPRLLSGNSSSSCLSRFFFLSPRFSSPSRCSSFSLCTFSFSFTLSVNFTFLLVFLFLLILFFPPSSLCLCSHPPLLCLSCSSL